MFMVRTALSKTLLGLVLLISLFLGLFVYQQMHHGLKGSPLNLKAGTYLTQGRPLPPFKLQKSDGTTLTASGLVGHWTILFFGYTQCRAICPTTMALLHQIYDTLRQQGVNVRPEMLMVSLDGQRDSQETMQNYVKAFDKDFLGAIGEQATIDALTKELGIVYTSQDKNGDIDHSGTITVINPMGEVVAFFTPPMQAKDVAYDLKTLINTVDLG